MSSLQVDTTAGWSASAHRLDHDGLSEEEHINFIEPHMWPPSSPDINPIPWITLFGVLISNESTPTTIKDGGRTEVSESLSGKNSHSVSLITVSMNGVDVLKLLSRMAADTSSIETWLEQPPHIILIPSIDKFCKENKHLTSILAVVFVSLGKVVTQ